MLSQLKRIARAMWSNPPSHGARIAAEVVGDAGMFEQWKGEMAGEAAGAGACTWPHWAPWVLGKQRRHARAACGAQQLRVPPLCSHARRSPRPAPGMAGRIDSVRKQLRASLEQRMPDRGWSFVTAQIGMFSYTGMSPQQVRTGQV